MIKRQITFPRQEPLTRSSAAAVVQTASRYESRVMIEHRSKIVNAKSMLGLLSLGADDQENMILMAEGEDEQAASDAVIALMSTL